MADLLPQIRSTTHQKKLTDNHIDANKGKIKGYLYLEDIFGFFKNFKKVTKNIGSHLMLKTNDLQDIIYTSMADDINVTINSLYLFVPNLIPSVETHLRFSDNHKISFDEGYTARRLISDLSNQCPPNKSQNNHS